MQLAAIISGLLFLQAAPAAGPPLNPVEWTFDTLTLTNGATFRGLIVSETPTLTTFRVVYRNPGRPTVTLTTTFGVREIASVKRLPAPERAALVARLDALDPTGALEKNRMRDLALTAAVWPVGQGAAWQYVSDRFTLISNAPEDITRRAAVRLEQIFAAYARFLPPRLAAAPTQIVLAGRRADYEAILGTPVRNPAVYDPTTGRIVCGSDLIPLVEALAAARATHAAERKKLDRAEATLRQLYKPTPTELERHLAPLVVERKRLRRADDENDAAFERATRQLFALLYHEAFHAYVLTSVYPPGGPGGELPRWLNEGLAQIFETAVVEAGELRVGHADSARLNRVQTLMESAPGLVPLGELLRSGQPLFLPLHAAEQAAADRAYLTAWALTFYLTFDRRLIDANGFAHYLTATEADPVRAFEIWVGQDLAEFERDFRNFVKHLTPNGTSAR